MTALEVFLQLVVINSKDMIPVSDSSRVQPGATDYEQPVDTYQKSVSERLVQLYALMCYIQCAIAFVAIFVVKRNNVQQC